ncbi:hypothetical protein L1887_08392 [Cichorium endivia]|nr:hypothetical protein L1887_08392 [Cichorium endivia]
MDDPREFMNQHQRTYPYSELVDAFSTQSFNGYLNMVTRTQSLQPDIIEGDFDKQQIHQTTRTGSCAPICGSSSSSFTISFGDLTSQTEINRGYKPKYPDGIIPKEEISFNELLGSIELPKRVSSTRRNHRQAQEHVLAERKRRERLTQRFMGLSALLPEIKKMDKAAVLEDASKYIKHLQNRVKELEEASVTGKNIIQESVASMKKSRFRGGLEDEASSCDKTNTSLGSTGYDPVIKVRISGSSILVRIYCGRSSALALKALTELERLHVTIMCNSVLPISETDVLITTIAQMGEEFVMTAMDLVKCLESSLSSFL